MLGYRSYIVPLAGRGALVGATDLPEDLARREKNFIKSSSVMRKGVSPIVRAATSPEPATQARLCSSGSLTRSSWFFPYPIENRHQERGGNRGIETEEGEPAGTAPAEGISRESRRNIQRS
jgi:hypothetical protein